MSDIVLFFPSAGLDIKGASIVLPLPMLCVAAPLVKAGYSVKIIDQRLDKKWHKSLEKELQDNPLCVGISAMTGKQIRGGLQASACVKKFSPEIPVVWGGIHGSLLPEQTVENPWVDIVVIGEGEQTFLELVSCLKTKQEYRNLPGICFKTMDGSIKKNPRRELVCLDELPELPYQLIDPAQYTTSFLLDKPELSHFASRGCPYDCAFCYNGKFNDQKWRMKSPKKIIRELKKIEAAGAGAVSFADEELFINKENIKELCELLCREKLNLKLMASCRINDLLRFDQEFLQQIIDAGFVAFYVGVESGSDKILKDINKQVTKQHVLDANNKLKNLSIDVYYSFMCGFPGETKEQVEETIGLMLSLYNDNPRAYILPIKAFTPYPGTGLFDICRSSGFVCPQKLEQWIDFKWHISQATWIDKKTKKFINIITHLTIFMDEKHCLKSKINRKIPLLGFMAVIYSKLIRFRLRRKLYFFNPDIMLFKALKFIFLRVLRVLSKTVLFIKYAIIKKNKRACNVISLMNGRGYCE